MTRCVDVDGKPSRDRLVPPQRIAGGRNTLDIRRESAAAGMSRARIPYVVFGARLEGGIAISGTRRYSRRLTLRRSPLDFLSYVEATGRQFYRLLAMPGCVAPAAFGRRTRYSWFQIRQCRNTAVRATAQQTPPADGLRTAFWRSLSGVGKRLRPRRLRQGIRSTVHTNTIIGIEPGHCFGLGQIA